MDTASGEILLTQYSRGAGCGCKIAPKLLEEMLQTKEFIVPDKNLLVGNNTNDDAAVYDLHNGQALISTTDFFMPIVDDPLQFGRIAAANAISDVYAMGGKPILALAILGWPVDKLPTHLAQIMLDGARETCAQAGIALAGGHSIDSLEPMFGLTVNGIVDKQNLKQNSTAQEGDFIFLTKKLGVGILASARKKQLLQPAHEEEVLKQMMALNKIGELLGSVEGVTAMTDVTGFGLAGHLIEMAEASGLSAEIYFSKIVLLPGVQEYIAQRAIPDATTRNWQSYGQKIEFEKGINVMDAFNLLPDPQTNGGILFTVKPSEVGRIQTLLATNGLQEHAVSIGRLVKKRDKTIKVLA